jgi:predicted membrane channel-forming protein YqfA (hemolysin III family)
MFVALMVYFLHSPPAPLAIGHHHVESLWASVQHRISALPGTLHHLQDNIQHNIHSLQDSIHGMHLQDGVHALQGSLSDGVHALQDGVHALQDSLSDGVHALQGSLSDGVHALQDGVHALQGSLSDGVHALQDSLSEGVHALQGQVSSGIQHKAQSLKDNLQHLQGNAHQLREQLNAQLHSAISPVLQYPSTRWPVYVYFAGAMACLLTSSVCHLLGCCSQHKSQLLWRLDYSGITVLLVASFFPPVFYGFLCEPFWRNFYLGSTSLFGMAVLVVSLADAFQQAKYRAFRAGLFAGLGLWGIVPVAHQFALHHDIYHVRVWLVLDLAMGESLAGAAPAGCVRIVCRAQCRGHARPRAQCPGHACTCGSGPAAEPGRRRRLPQAPSTWRAPPSTP